MRRPLFFMTLIGGLLLAGSGPVAYQTAAPPATGTGVIAGQVVEATTRRPVAGAIVTLSVNNAPSPTSPATTRRAVAVANSEGRFVFRDLPAGAFSIATSLDGFVGGAFGRRRPGGPTRSITLADGARVIDAVIQMWRMGAIAGTVRDDRGEPVVGVSVWGMRRTLTSGSFKLSYASVESTDDRGQYRLTNLSPGSFAIVVRTPMQSASVATADAYRIAVTSGTTADIRSNWLASGAVQIEREGLLVDDWQVSVSHGGIPPLPGPNGTLFVHPEVFYANASSASEATLVTLESGAIRTGVDLVLPLVQGVRVSGTLTAPDGPAAGHGLRLRAVATGDVIQDSPVAYSISDQAGRFAFHGVTPGNYTIEAHRITQRSGPTPPPPPPAGGGIPVSRAEPLVPLSGPPLYAEMRVAVGASHVDGVSLLLKPGARLSGRVVFDGASPPPAAQLSQIVFELRPVPEFDAGRPNPARADPEGRFTTAGHAPGRYMFQPMSLPWSQWTLASVRVGSEDAAAGAFTLGPTDINDVVVTFTDRVTSLSGTVRSEPSGDPESTVVVYPADFDAWIASGMSSRRVIVAPVSQAGTYDLRIAVPGEYMVVAVPPEITAEVDREFVRRFGAAAVHVSFALGDKKVQPLVVRPQR